MSKSVDQPFLQEALDHFNIKEPCYTGFFFKKGSVNNFLEADYNKYLEVKDIIDFSESKDLNNYKKVFILPRNETKLDFLKNVAKENNLVITNNYKDADLIVSNNNLVYSGRLSNTKSNYSFLISHGYRMLNTDVNSILNLQSKGDYTAFVDLARLEKEVKRKIYKLNTTFFSSYFISGLALNIAYLSDTGKVDIMSESDFVSQGKKLLITSELVDNIGSMIRSNSEDDINIGLELVLKIDPTKNLYYLYKLHDILYYNSNKWRRNKAVAFFVDQLPDPIKETSGLLHLIKSLDVANLLVKEDLILFLNDLRNQLKLDYCINDYKSIYQFKVSLNPEFKAKYNL